MNLADLKQELTELIAILAAAKEAYAEAVAQHKAKPTYDHYAAVFAASDDVRNSQREIETLQARITEMEEKEINAVLG